MVQHTHANIVWIGQKMIVKWSRFLLRYVKYSYLLNIFILPSWLNNLHQNSTAPLPGYFKTQENFLVTNSKSVRRIAVKRLLSFIFTIAMPPMKNVTLPAPQWQSLPTSSTTSKTSRLQGGRSSFSSREKSKWSERPSWKQFRTLVK